MKGKIFMVLLTLTLLLSVFLGGCASWNKEFTLIIEVQGAGTVNYAEGEHKFAKGTLVELTATPLAGWQFKEWIGEVQNLESATTTVLLNKDKTVQAVFEKKHFNLDIIINGEGVIVKEPDQEVYLFNTVVTLSAIPDSDWVFINWEGDVENNSSLITKITMDEDKTIEANFEPKFTASGYVRLVDNTPLSDVKIEFDGGFDAVRTDQGGFWIKEGLWGEVNCTPFKDKYSFGPSSQVVKTTATNVDFVAIEDLDVTLYSNVRVFTDAESENIVAVDPQGTISFFQVTPFVNSFGVGDTLIGGITSELPQGLMVKITEISEDQKEIYTVDATLNDVIQEGSIVVTESVSFEELLEHLEFAADIEVIDVDTVNYSIEIKVSLPHGVTIKGVLTLGSALDIAMEMGWLFGLDHFHCVLQTYLDLDLSVSAELSGYLNEEVLLGTFTAPGVLWISVIPPVFLTLQFDFLVGLEGTVAVELATGAQWSRSYDVGFSFNRDAIPQWTTINNQDGSGWIFDKPDLTGTASLKSYAGVRFSGLTYGLVGLWVGAYAFCEAEAVMALNPWRWQYELGVGLEGALGARLNILGITDLTYEPGRLRLWYYPAAYGISGRVTDQQGNGIENVSIGFSEGITAVKTNSEGYWQAHFLSSTVVVRPRMDGYSFEPEQLEVTEAASDVDFIKQPLIYDIEGKVIDGENQGVSGVEISFSDGYSSVYSDGDGFWSKSGLQGEIIVKPVESSYAFSPDSIKVDNYRYDLTFLALSSNCPIAGVRISYSVENILFWMRLAPAASFPRGACDSKNGNINTPYWIAETQVTDELWHALRAWALDNGYSYLDPYQSFSKKPKDVYWTDAVAWCNALSEYFGFDPVYRYWDTDEIIRRGNFGWATNVRWDLNANGFRLPTYYFGEWELAARYIGSLPPSEEPLQSEAIFRDNLYWTPGNYASGARGPCYNPTDHNATTEVAWYVENSNNEMHDVAQKQPNALGLFDMSGNLPDWLFDSTVGAMTDYKGYVGGFYFSDPLELMIGYHQDTPRFSLLGIRLLRNF